MYNNNRFNNNNRSQFGSNVGINIGREDGGIGSLMGGHTNSLPLGNSGSILQGNSPEAKARLGIEDPITQVDRSGMDSDFQKRHFGGLATADKMYAGSANDTLQTGIDQQIADNRLRLGTEAQNYNAQRPAAKQERPKPMIYDSSDYTTWFDDM